jgi:hypothetical protein
MNGEVSSVSLGLEDTVPSLASNEEMQMRRGFEVACLHFRLLRWRRSVFSVCSSCEGLRSEFLFAK